MNGIGLVAGASPMDTDMALVARARAGDREAFGRLVERHQSLVCAVAYSATGDVALSEDVAQEAFLAAWRGLVELREPEKVRGWLAGIARNLARNVHRRQAAAPLTAPLEAARDVADPEPTPAERALGREQQEMVRRALADMPEAYREPLVLFYREEQSIVRVAQALELSEDAVKQRLSRGRRMLREQLADLVEQALAGTRPGKAFTVAVLAALPAALPQTAAAGIVAAAAKGSTAAQAGAAAGLAGVVMGPLIGIAGAWVGAKASIENTRSPRERAFMKRMAWVGAAYVLGFLAVQGALVLLAPDFWASLYGQLTVWSLYVVGLFTLIAHTNRRQYAIRVEDGTAPPAVPLPGPAMTRRAVYGSLGGGVFGSVCWLFPMCAIAGDWVLAAATAVVAGGLFVAGARRAAAEPQRYPRVARAVFVALALWNVLLVNLRWEQWMVAFRQSPFAATSIELPLWAMNLLLAVVTAQVWVALGRLEWRQAGGEPGVAGRVPRS